MSKHYEESGVSLTRGYEAVRRIRGYADSTRNKGVMSEVGSFGGLFDLSAFSYKNPVLVSGTDGVGTKLLLAQKANHHSTIGIDLVAMCVNDVLSLGAKPLYFLDYIATSKIDPDTIKAIVAGIADGCRRAGCALIGGETAEMPGMYQSNHYDLAGFTTGVVEKERLIDPGSVRAGDVLIGLPSSGLHSNGFSLVRKILFTDNRHSLHTVVEELEAPLQEVLLEPTSIYVESVLSVLKMVQPHAIAHITGGGFHENIPRVLPENLGVEIDTSSFPLPRIFSYLARLGKIKTAEMYHVFNMGIGMVLIVDGNDADKVQSTLAESNQTSYVIGRVTEGVGVNIR